MNKKIILIFLAIGLLIAGVIFLIPENSPAPESTSGAEEYGSYFDPATGVSFSFPVAWGRPNEAPGNTTCPDDDTYRTRDTLIIFDRELRFADFDIPNSESIIRLGLRFREFDPKNPAVCDEDIMKQLAAGKITGEEISSVRLEPVEQEGLRGVYNANASRLDTEARVQYAFFKELAEERVLIIQPYMSFIPYSGSPEWDEIDTLYRNNMSGYLEEGDTAESVRRVLAQFRKFTESIKIKQP